jgi:hypothetical protein
MCYDITPIYQKNLDFSSYVVRNLDIKCIHEETSKLHLRAVHSKTCTYQACKKRNLIFNFLYISSLNEINKHTIL